MFCLLSRFYRYIAHQKKIDCFGCPSVSVTSANKQKTCAGLEIIVLNKFALTSPLLNFLVTFPPKK